MEKAIRNYAAGQYEPAEITNPGLNAGGFCISGQDFSNIYLSQPQ